MKKSSILIHTIFAICLCQVITAHAQTAADALRYTQVFTGSTARSTALGGAMGAVGADFSCASINPAGLGLYRKSELVFTPSIQSTNNESKFFGNSVTDFKSSLNLNNWGVTLSSKEGKDDNFEEWKYVNLSVGLNRYSLFSTNTTIAGDNIQSSISRDYIDRANGSTSDNLDPFISGLAYQAYFLNPYPQDSTAYYSESYDAYKKRQTKVINRSGSMGETTISLAGNYANRWYLGASLGFARIVYYENSNFSERDAYQQLGNFKEFVCKEKLSTKGSGINLKLGVLYRPADWIRLGTSLHTSTTYGLTDFYSVDMTTTFDTTQTKTASADNADGYSYKLRTPMRVVNSIAFVFGKRGFLSFDHEWLNYRRAMFSPSAELGAANTAIGSTYTQAHNIKAGAEVNLNPIAIRVGYTMLGNAFQKGFNTNTTCRSYTAGFGFRSANFFADVALVITQYGADYYYLYNSNYVPAAKITSQRTSLVTGIGFKW